MAKLYQKTIPQRKAAVDSHVSPSAMNDRQEEGYYEIKMKQLWCNVRLQSANRFKSAPGMKIGRSQNSQEKAPGLSLQRLKYVNDLLGHQTWKL